jgi:hypothetical protein
MSKIQCGATTATGACKSTWFFGLYECENPKCTVWKYEDSNPTEITPDSLPSRKACPGCKTDNGTFIFRCKECGTIHDFCELAPVEGAKIV